MPNSLLTTKLFIPLPRLNQVPRDRLIQRLSDGLAQPKPLTLVSAPAGFGKTTLISAWLRQLETDWPVAWVSLDEGDNDPALFVRYLVAGIQKADPVLGENLQRVLTMAQAPGQPASLVELGTPLINAVSQCGSRLLLVLDDYHLIHLAEIHTFVQMLIEHHPEGMHTVLLTREDPPFPLPRLRARGQLTEIRERDLRFTQMEAQLFFDQSMGLELLPQWVDILAAQTEGWVAGLQLAALAIQESPDPASIERFLQTFAGSDRYVIDYLLDEVYHRQPAEIQDFLLRSSILERMCAPLCDQLLAVGATQELTGKSAELLQRVEHGNLFLIPLDNLRTWYRYHHLFAELLRHRLLQERNHAFVSALHRAASGWFEAQGYILDAIRHAFQTRDWAFSVPLVERYAMSIVSRSQMATLLEWYRQIPEQVLRERPLACIYMAWTLVLAFREDYRETVETWLQRAEQSLQSELLPVTAQIGPTSEPVNLRNYLTGQVALIRSQNLLAAFQEPVDPQTLISLSLQALDLLPASIRLERSVCTINLALAQLVLSQAEAAQTTLVKAYHLALEAENYFGAVTTLWYQARLAFYRGENKRTEAIYHENLELFRSIAASSGQDLPAIRSLYVAQALVCFEQNRLDETEQLLGQSLDMTGWASWVELWAYYLYVRLHQAKGNPARVLQTLDRMEKLGPQFKVCAIALRVLHDLTASPTNLGTSNQARAWVDSHAPDQKRYGVVNGLGPYHCDALYLKDMTWVRIQLELGDAAGALAFLEPVLEVARQNQLVYRVVETCVLKAVAQDIAGTHKAALHTLQEALAQAEPHGYVRVFDQGPALDFLLAETYHSGAYPETIQSLARAFQRPFLEEAVASTPKAAPAGQAGLVEPLSEREMEVLRLIAMGFSNQEIGEKLVIAFGTVKRHANSIYGKLGVQSRTQAVDKARRLGLLS